MLDCLVPHTFWFAWRFPVAVEHHWEAAGTQAGEQPQRVLPSHCLLSVGGEGVL